MARRKTGKRYPGGKLKQPSAAERSKISAERARMEAEFVQHQPHRRGFAVKDDTWLESEVGRFCRLHGLREEVFEAAKEWANIARLYGAAWGAPQDERHSSPGLTGEGPSMETQAKWKAQLQGIEEKLYGEAGANKARYSATMRLVLRRVIPSRELAPYAVDGLRVVAIYFRKMSARDAPFQSAA
jgi:hypothetical protein